MSKRQARMGVGGVIVGGERGWCCDALWLFSCGGIPCIVRMSMVCCSSQNIFEDVRWAV